MPEETSPTSAEIVPEPQLHQAVFDAANEAEQAVAAAEQGIAELVGKRRTQS
jgi:hypothetical protein